MEEGIEKVLVERVLLSNEFQLLGFNNKEEVDLGSYLQIPIKKDSKVRIRSMDGGIETIFSLFKIEKKVVDLFNLNSEFFGLPVRGKVDSNKRHLIFYGQIP